MCKRRRGRHLSFFPESYMSLRSRLLRFAMVGGAVMAFWATAAAQQPASPSALPPALGQGGVPAPKPAPPTQTPAPAPQAQTPAPALKDPVVATINGQPLRLSEIE